MRAKISILFLLALLSFTLTYSESFGPSRIILEKTWTISGDPGTRFSLDGIFVANTSYQKVVELDGTRGITFAVMPDGAIKVLYNGTLTQGSTEIKAEAVVDVDYDVTLPSDFPLPSEQIAVKANSPTDFTPEMAKKAKSMVELGSLFGTVRNVADWTNKEIDYDISYFGKTLPAKKVFEERKGVCVEYSHLFIAMMNSLGVKTRYVSGHVLGEEWQPHAWVEVELPDGGILPVDPTFGQAQNLDNTHVASFFSEDQSEVLDKLESNGEVVFDSSEALTIVSSEKAEPKFSIASDFNEKTEAVRVNLANNNPNYLFASYRYILPNEAGESDRSLLVFFPKEKKNLDYSLRNGYAVEGYAYSVPILVTLNDQEMKKEILFSKPAGVVPNSCAVPTVLLLLATAIVLKR
jgi:hypothetical protein